MLGRKKQERLNESEHDHHRHECLKRAVVHSSQRPYWKRAHKDWRFCISAVLMFAAIVTYVMSDDLARRPRSDAPSPLSGGVGK